MPGGRNPLLRAFLNQFPCTDDKFKTQRVKCLFCSIIISKNGSRMVKHFVKCEKCTDDIKVKYLSGFTGTNPTTSKQVASLGFPSAKSPQLSFSNDEVISLPCTSISTIKRNAPPVLPNTHIKKPLKRLAEYFNLPSSSQKN